MPTRQGDVGLLRDPVAQQLLQSKSPAHLAYTWRDGTPRVVPIGFHWNGQEIVLATATDAPKTKVLKNGSKVAVSGRVMEGITVMGHTFGTAIQEHDHHLR